MSADDFFYNAGYLPEVLKDFHDQKDIFKCMSSGIKTYSEKNKFITEISWCDLQCYSIDVFLWFMAKHGYTLQRSRKKINFNDLTDTINSVKEKEIELLSSILKR